MKKVRQSLALIISCVFVLSACGQQNKETTNTNSIPNEETKVSTVTEGKDTNNGRPYNLQPTKYDSRDDKYLNGINATVLPISDKPVEITIWRQFTSTVMKGYDESEVFKELEKRTNVKIKWIYPPVGSEQDNFTLRITSDDLPHIFSGPGTYPGGTEKAVSDGVYLDLTPYYDKGLMPNIKYLRDKNPTFNRDFVNDEGKMYYFPMVDIIPSHPWSGLWLRKDWIDEIGIKTPTTIADWDSMLRTMKSKKGGFVLGLRTDWRGMEASYAFTSAFESAFKKFINKDGKVVYGSIEPGYKDFLTLMNTWYKDGLLDPDFATRTGEDYSACIANGKVGAFSDAYGEVGQQIQTGKTIDPKYQLVPIISPVAKEGQQLHLRQTNSIVRSDRDIVTTRASEDGVADIIMRWKDYWYSQDGGDLCSYGVEGRSYKWNEKGTVDWIHPDLVSNPDADFSTLMLRFKLHNFGYLRDSSAYKYTPEALDSIKVWGTQDDSWVMPDNISLTIEESNEYSNIITDINTYVEEMTSKFIMGQRPLSEFDNYVKQIKSMNIDRAIKIQQTALDRYNKR